jgi:hypothetical protein
MELCHVGRMEQQYLRGGSIRLWVFDSGARGA